MIKSMSSHFFVLSVLAGMVFVLKPVLAQTAAPWVPPAFLRSSVDRVLPSKPGDLFVQLNNGMTVLIRQESRSDAVSAYIYVKAGSIFEGRSFGAGLSHYLEHVVAGGTTESFTENEAKRRLEALGGASNAYTSHDRTVYFINTSSAHCMEALDLLLSYVSECKLKESEVLREKAVIQQEFKLGENNPRRQLWDLFLQTAYRVHPVRYPVIGYESIFVNQDRQALYRYYHQRYQPQNMVVAVVGNIDPEEVIQHIVRKTKKFQRNSIAPAALPQEPPQISPRWATKQLDLARLTQAIISFPSVSLAHHDLYALDVLALMLGQGETSRLYERLKERENLVLSVSAYNWTPSFVHGQFIVSLTLDPKNWSAALQGVEDEIKNFKKTGANQEELWRAKKKVIAEHVFGRETVSEMASSLAASYFDTGDPYFDEAYVEGIRAVKVDDVQRVAMKYLDPGKMNVAVVEPAAKVHARNKKAESTLSSPVSVPIEPVQMNNGLRLLLKEDHQLPIVTLQLYGLGGLLLEDWNKPGISYFTASLLTAGTKTRSKQEIMRAIEDVGGQITSGSGNNTYFVSLKVLKEDLDIALDVLADVVQNAQFPPEEISKQRQETLLAIQRQDENWQREIVRMFKQNYFKNHPYRHDELGTKESVQAFTRQDILECYRKMVRPGQSVLAVFGDFNREVLLQKVRTAFASWQGPAVSIPDWPDESHPLVSNNVVERKNKKTSAALFVGTNGLTIDDPRRPALDVLDALLSGIGYPSGRLQEALRGGDADLVYVVHAYPFYGVKGGYFGVITQTTMGNLPEVQEIIFKQLRLLQDKPVTKQELQLAKDMVITMHHLTLESLGAQAQRAAVNEVLGLGWDYDKRYVKLVKEVTIQDVQEIARDLFGHTLLVRTLPENPVEILGKPMPKADY